MTAPDLVEVVARAMFSHEQCDRRQKIDLEANWLGRLNDDNRDEYRDLARAVLAALTEAGNVEWAIFRKQDGPNSQPFDTFTHTTMGESQSRIDRMYLPELRDVVEPRSRLTLPWTAAE